MYNGMLIQNLDIADVSSERRNPILANVMAQLDICNETKALNGYKDELKPMFKSTPTQFQTTIYASSDEPEIEDVPKDVPKELSERQNIILDLIKENPLVTIPEMSLKTGVVARTVKRDIEYLQAKGVIVRKGGRKEGHWKILKSE